MDTPFEISKWRDTFETHESRKYKTLTWVSVPISLGYGYEAMLAEFGDETAAIYGAWILMTTIAATAPNRGVLADSRNRPYSPDFLARKTGIPADLFRRLIAWASTDEVAWLVPFTGRSPGDHRDEVGTTDSSGMGASPPVRPSLPSAPPTAHLSPVAEVAKTSDVPAPSTNENPTNYNTGRSPGDHREIVVTPPADRPGLPNLTLPNLTLPNVTLPNQTLPIIDRSIDRSMGTEPAPGPAPSTSRPEPTPSVGADPLAKARDRMDRLIDDKVFLKEVCELATNLKKGKVHKHSFWYKATREQVWQIVFAGCVFGRECLENCMYTIANGTKQGPVLKPEKYIDASFRKMLHEHHGVSWEQLRNHIPVPAPPPREPIPVSS